MSNVVFWAMVGGFTAGFAPGLVKSLWRGWQDGKSDNWDTYYECLYCGMHLLDADDHNDRCVIGKASRAGDALVFILCNPIKCIKAVWRDKGFTNVGDR